MAGYVLGYAPMSEQRTIDEQASAVALANRLLDQPYADPDDDLRVLSRQLLRRQEELNKYKAALVSIGEQACGGAFTEHGDCPATYACSAIIAELIHLGMPPKGVEPA